MRGLQMREARKSMKWHGQTGRGVMDKPMGKMGWSDAIAHDNTDLDELFVQLPYNVRGGEKG